MLVCVCVVDVHVCSFVLVPFSRVGTCCSVCDCVCSLEALSVPICFVAVWLSEGVVWVCTASVFISTWPCIDWPRLRVVGESPLLAGPLSLSRGCVPGEAFDWLVAHSRPSPWVEFCEWVCLLCVGLLVETVFLVFVVLCGV